MPNFIFKIVLELYNDRIAYSRSDVFLIKSRHSRLGDALQFSKRLRSRYLVCSPRPRETAEATSRRRPPQGCPSTGQCQTRTSTALSLCHRYTHWHSGTPGATGARKRLRAPHYLKRIFFLSHRYRSPALTEGLLFTNRHSFTATTPVSIVCNLFHFWGGGDPPLFLKFHLLFDLSSTYKLHVEQLAF